MELENQNNHLNKSSEDLVVWKKKKIINDTSSLKELYKIDIEKCKLNNNPLLIIKDKVKNFNKGMRDLINLTRNNCFKIKFFNWKIYFILKSNWLIYFN